MVTGNRADDLVFRRDRCFETSRPNTHVKLTYVEEGAVHYCIANMPGGAARNSTFALNNATLPFTLALANKGYRQALADDPHLRNGPKLHCATISPPSLGGCSRL